MDSSSQSNAGRIVVDSIHGDIRLSGLEWRVVDTATFQRLRHLKQLGMAHFTYPNATHTRFAHSLGALRIMQRILAVCQRRGFQLTDDEAVDLRLAALLHDVGHYPYSHLMEGVDKVQLAEEIADGADHPKQFDAKRAPYPGHEDLGRTIVTAQDDLLKAIGGQERASRVGNWFSQSTATNPQLSKLISSSLDMDRMDYLLRDANAAGVPYGQIDINYLLNSVDISTDGMVGVSEKALPAAEHFLFARYFMHLAVYFHKTTFAFEEATRQLLRRIRETKASDYDLPPDGRAVEELVKSTDLQHFTDAFVDQIVRKATGDSDPCIQTLAKAIQTRRPPKLLKQVTVLQPEGQLAHAGVAFKQNFKFKVKQIADKHSVPLGRFLFCRTKELSIEKRGARLTFDQAKQASSEEHDELIKVFIDGETEPRFLVDVERTLVNHCAGHVYQSHRLYFVCTEDDPAGLVSDLQTEVKNWDRPE